MTKKILILCRRDDRLEYDRRITMLAAFEKLDTTTQYFGADFEDLLFRYDGNSLTVTDAVSGVDIRDFDAAFLIGWFKSKILDDTARAAAHYLHAHGVPIANSEAYHGRSFSKLSQLVIAAVNGVRTTPFVFSLDQGIIRKAIQNESELLGFPFILKALTASRGNDNYLIDDESQLDVIDEVTDPPKFFIAQRFVPNDGDYRILAMGGTVRRVIHRRAGDDTHLNNTSKGGAATMMPVDSLPDEVIRWTLDLARIFRREVTGIDMIMHRDTGEYFFLESNNMPQLATGSFVTEKMQALDEFLCELAEGGAERYID